MTPADVSGFLCVTTQHPHPAWGILTSFPFDNADDVRLYYKELTYVLGSSNPWTNAVLMEPFSTSVFKVLIWIFATTTKICTKHRSIQVHTLDF